MDTRITKQLDILMGLISHDREEIRLIKNNIYTIVTSLISLSFVLSAFLLKDYKRLIPPADIFIIIFILLYFLVRFKDLRNTRMCLEMRQRMLVTVENNPASGDFDPFKKVEKNKPIGIKDNDLIIHVILGLLFLLVKIVCECVFL